MPLPLVAIVGRPNVGKSALFNRLVRRRIAIVEDLAGTTRDRLYATCQLWHRSCAVVDTGGFDPTEKTGYTAAVLQQTSVAIEEADVVIFLVDGREEPTLLDYEIAERLRRSKKPVVLARNKLDTPSVAPADHYALRMGAGSAVSAVTGSGVAELVEDIEDLLPPEVEEPESETGIRIAVVGRPNVGKSLLTNVVLGYERSIVAAVPGTTRDAVDTTMQWKESRLTLIDTAGIRRKARVRADDTSLEYHMVLRSLRAMDRCDVVVLVLDSSGVTEQDTKIAGYSHEAGKGMLIAVNKWDLVEAGDSPVQRKARADFQEMITRYLPFTSYAPVHYISALTNSGVEALVDDTLAVAGRVGERISTGRLNDVLRDAVGNHPPPGAKNQVVRIRYATMAEVSPPTIILFCNHPDLLHFSYLRYLENCIRRSFPMPGVPLRIEVRPSTTKKGDEPEGSKYARSDPSKHSRSETPRKLRHEVSTHGRHDASTRSPDASKHSRK